MANRVTEIMTSWQATKRVVLVVLVSLPKKTTKKVQAMRSGNSKTIPIKTYHQSTYSFKI